jgi:hypothetical protein
MGWRELEDVQQPRSSRVYGLGYARKERGGRILLRHCRQRFCYVESRSQQGTRLRQYMSSSPPFIDSYSPLSTRLQEAMRSAIISDVDGSTEYNKVQLAPTNWAWLAKQKAESGPKGETVESLTWKISRLGEINLVLDGMIAVRGPSYCPPSVGDTEGRVLEPRVH